MNDLSYFCNYTLYDVPDCGLALEAIIIGKHPEWPKFAIIDCISRAIATQKPSVLIINLTRFKCASWEHIERELIGALAYLHRLGGSRTCRVVAQGETAEVVGKLLRFAELLWFFGGRIFSDLESALLDARSSLGAK